MSYGPQTLLVGAVAAVGVLHTIVPDHWVPITLIARQKGWSKVETLRAALQAGTGHVLSTLAIAAVVWWAGIAVAERFGHVVDTVSSLALILFGAWFAISAWRELRSPGGHGHSHHHGLFHPEAGHDHSTHGSVHGPELQRIALPDGLLEVSIFESGVPPRFRLSGIEADEVTIETRREQARRQAFRMVKRGEFWESVEEIPEPHEFEVSIVLEQQRHIHRSETRFLEPAHGGHGGGHDHAHTADDHRRKKSGRTALLLILGSSPMVEGIPAFFAAAKYGAGIIAIMAVVFAISTIATYALLCVYSVERLRQVRLGAFERYGEVMSGVFIALVGLAFWFWPVL